MKIRDVGKIINLGRDYGKTPFSIKDDLGITIDEAERLVTLIDSKTPKKSEYFKKKQNFAKKLGYVIIDWITKTRSHFYRYEEYLQLSKIPYNEKTREEVSKFYRLKGQLERFAQNYPRQAWGSN